MTNNLELNHLDHKIYSAIEQIRRQKNRADIKKLFKLLTLRQLAKSS